MPTPPNELWLALLEAEQARRTAQKAYNDGEADRLRLRLWEEMELAGERLLPYTEPSLVHALVNAPDWAAVDRFRTRADLAPADAVALIATQDPEAACRLMVEWVRHHSA
jgi:hypothetical protein